MVHLVLDQLGEVGWKPNPMPAAPRLIFIAYGNTPAPLHPNHAIGNTEAVIPDFEFLVALPRDFRVDQGERSRAKIHDDDPLADADLWRSHGAAEAAALAEIVKRRMETCELPAEISVRPTDFGGLLFEARVPDREDWKRRGHSLLRRAFEVFLAEHGQRGLDHLVLDLRRPADGRAELDADYLRLVGVLTHDLPRRHI